LRPNGRRCKERQRASRTCQGIIKELELLMLEQVKARIADLEKQKEQMLANFHAISGAIAENEAWLKQLSVEKPTEND